MSIIKCNKCKWTADTNYSKNLDYILKEHYEGHQFEDMLKCNFTIVTDDKREGL